MEIIRLLGNIIPVVFGVIAIRKWRSLKLSKTEIISRLGFHPFSTFQLLTGLLIGALIFTLIFFVFKYFDLLTIIQFSWTGGEFFTTILLFAALTIGEELIFRSFFINGLKLYLQSATLIITITALFFSVVHWFNEGSTVISAISAFLGGLMYAFAFIKTEKLWLPIGLHFSWNFFQSLVYGFPVSGFVFDGLFEVNIVGPQLWTGGEYGPEGGLIGIIARIIVLFAIWLVIKIKYGR
jgi:membrane protease YdiL (CAAX protease family)